MYRKFKLINEANEELDLSEVGVLFLEQVTGLGETISLETENISNFLKITSKTTEVKEIEGLLKFGNDVSSSYRQYIRFSGFIKESRKLTLAYALPLPFLNFTKNETVYANCIVTQQSKSEATEYSRLEESVKFTLLEPWHSQEIKKVIQSSRTNGNIYDNEQEYDVPYDDYNFSNNKLLNLSTTEVPVRFYISGVSTNPKIALRNTKNDKAEVVWQYQGTVASGDKLSHNSHPGQKRWVKINDVTNVYDKVNKAVGFNSIVMIPPGIFNVEFTCDNDDYGDLEIYYQNYWSVI